MRVLAIISFLLFALSESTHAQRYDSIDGGYPVVLKQDTLFLLYSRVGPYHPVDRINIIQRRINTLLNEVNFSPDSLFILESEFSSDIWYKDRIIFSVTSADAKAEGQERAVLAKHNLVRLQKALKDEIQESSFKTILIRIGLTLFELLIIYLIIRYINKLFVFTRKWLIRQKENILKGIKFKGYEFLDSDRELMAALFINNVLRWVVIVIVLYISLPLLFSIFPWTRGFAERLFGYVLNPLRDVLMAVFNYIPNIFTIAVIYFVVRYTVRFIGFLASEIEKGSLTISGFYPDWAKPTFNIVKVLLYAFMFIVIFPYLPGSDSPVFQGVSVFLGILFSLGSSTAISNMVAGLVITYMRPFKIGDRIKIGEVTGDVLEKSALVTRIRTIKNEDITIPNATILAVHTVNYSASAKELGLILHTGVTIGYDVPWKQVHELLIAAAQKTEGILQDTNRKPFVLQTSLDDFYVSYQLNVYTEQPEISARIYSVLHSKIQDKFNEAGIEILSPHYKALRDGNRVAIPSNYLPKDYEAPSFNVEHKPEAT